MEIIKLNLIPNGVNPVCHTAQYDSNRVIRIELFDGLIPYILKSGDLLTLKVQRRDNNLVTVLIPSTQGNTYVDLETTTAMTEIDGLNLCILEIDNGSVHIGTLKFYMTVQKAVDGEAPPAPVENEPLILGGYSRNANTIGALSHTFDSSGKYQFIILKNSGDGMAFEDPVVKLNNTVLTPRIDSTISYTKFYYGEIDVNEGDVITAEDVTAISNSGFQLYVLENADLSSLSAIGAKSNGQGSFDLPLDVWILQIYKCGYYQSNNNFSYRLEKHKLKNNTGTENTIKSIATPPDPQYWYGFTTALTI